LANGNSFKRWPNCRAADYKAKTGIEATIFFFRPASGATVIKG
jgi:hypothetical protein